MSDQDRYWKIIWNNVKLSARYGAGGGRVHKGSNDARDLTITIDDIKDLWNKQDGRCYWLDIKMILEDLEIKNSPFAPSVERLNNDLGYIRGNVVLASRFANRGRGAYDGEDFKERLESLLSEAKEATWTKKNTKSNTSLSALYMMKSLVFGHMKSKTKLA